MILTGLTLETNNTIGLVNYSKPTCFAYAGNPRFVLIETGKNLDPNGENIEFKVQVFPESLKI